MIGLWRSFYIVTRIMRKRIKNRRVCRCLPDGVVFQIEARLLRELVNREVHSLRCFSSGKMKYMRGMRLGLLCSESGHLGWAKKIWSFTLRLIEDRDWELWHDVWFDNRNVRLRDVVCEIECEDLLRLISDVWRQLGQEQYAFWNEEREHIAKNVYGSYYSDLWIYKYDYCPVKHFLEYEKLLKDYAEESIREKIFADGQCSFQSSKSLSVFDN